MRARCSSAPDRNRAKARRVSAILSLFLSFCLALLSYSPCLSLSLSLLYSCICLPVSLSLSLSSLFLSLSLTLCVSFVSVYSLFSLPTPVSVFLSISLFSSSLSFSLCLSVSFSFPMCLLHFFRLLRIAVPPTVHRRYKHFLYPDTYHSHTIHDGCSTRECNT